MSESADLNPAFYNWNKVFVKYCDGAIYQGSAEPIPYGEGFVYFRGYDNMKAIFDDLITRRSMGNSDIVVLSGGSAGGIGAFVWN